MDIPGYKTYDSYNNKNNYQFKNPQSQLRNSNQAFIQAVSQVSNDVANVCAYKDSRQFSLPPVNPQLTSGGMNLNLQSFSPQQIQNLISQFNVHVQVSGS